MGYSNTLIDIKSFGALKLLDSYANLAFYKVKSFFEQYTSGGRDVPLSPEGGSYALIPFQEARDDLTTKAEKAVKGLYISSGYGAILTEEALKQESLKFESEMQIKAAETLRNFFACRNVKEEVLKDGIMIHTRESMKSLHSAIDNASKVTSQYQLESLYHLAYSLDCRSHHCSFEDVNQISQNALNFKNPYQVEALQFLVKDTPGDLIKAQEDALRIIDGPNLVALQALGADHIDDAVKFINYSQSYALALDLVGPDSIDDALKIENFYQFHALSFLNDISSYLTNNVDLARTLSDEGVRASELSNLTELTISQSDSGEFYVCNEHMCLV